MSIRISASGEGLVRTTSLPSVENYTLMVLAYVVNDRPDAWRFIGATEDASVNSGSWTAIGWSATNVFHISSNPGSTVNFSASPSLGTWFWVALTGTTAGTNSMNGYWRYLSSSDGTTRVVSSLLSNSAFSISAFCFSISETSFSKSASGLGEEQRSRML